MAVAGRTGVAGAEIEVTDEGVALFVEGEGKAHSIGIVGAADEAVVLGGFQVAGFVAMRLAGHGGILSWKSFRHRGYRGIVLSLVDWNPVYISVLGCSLCSDLLQR